MNRILIAIGICIVTFGSGCAGAPPVKDFTLARTAIDAARKAGAPRYAPGFWNRAEEHYRRASILYKDRYYEEAKQLFKKARVYAEKAENSTRLKKFKSGDGFS